MGRSIRREALLRVFERFPRHDGHGVMWAIVLALLDELFDRDADLSPAVTPVLRLLDRFHHVDACALAWPAIHGLESLDEFPGALVASLQAAPTKIGLTLLMRLQGLRGIQTIDGVDVATLAATLTGGGT